MELIRAGRKNLSAGTAGNVFPEARNQLCSKSELLLTLLCCFPFWPLHWKCQGKNSSWWQLWWIWAFAVSEALLSAPLSTWQLLISQSQLVLSLWSCSGYDSPEWLRGTRNQMRKGKETFLETPWFCTTHSGRFCKFWLRFVNFFFLSFKSEPVPMSLFI